MEYKIKPWAHQLAAIERGKDLPNFGLFFDVGVGKTSASINILRHKFNEAKRVMRTLILGPPIILENWRREWLAHSNIKPEMVCVLYGPGKKRVELLREKGWSNGQRVSRIFITNYEGLLMPDLFKALMEWGPEVLVCDESSRLKEAKAKRTKQAVLLADHAKVRHILTGTPVTNSPMDLFSQFRVLDGGKTFGKNFFVFRNTYFFDKNAGMPPQRYFPDWRIKPGALEQMNQAIQAITARAKKSECLDLPPYVREVVYVELAPEQARVYEEMQKDFLSHYEGEVTSAELAITKGLRLQQITSGFIKGESGALVPLDDNPRAAALEQLLLELTPNHKVLVWAVFQENYRAIRKVCEKIGVKYVEVHGEISGKEKFESVDALNTDPTVRVLIGHPGSGGIGINLIAASYSIFFSRSFSLEHDLQAEARNYRGGSEVHAKVTRIDIVAKDTIDEIVAIRLAEKQAISDKVLGDIAREIKGA